MTLREAFRFVVENLKEAGVENPQLEAMILLSYLLGISKEKVITAYDFIVQPDKEEELKHLVSRRKKRVPLAYIIKSKEFFGLDFYVEEGVLIPRPETEILVQELISRLPSDRELTGLEVGVGSGCISISILKHRANVKIVGIDVSDKALEVTSINADRHNVGDRLTLKKISIFDNPDFGFPFDFVVSNPPYIRENEYQHLMEEVKFEPVEALISGKEGTEFYEKITEWSATNLKKGGILAFEVGMGQADKVKQMMETAGFKEIEIIKDLQGIDRVVIGYNDGG